MKKTNGQIGFIKNDIYLKKLKNMLIANFLTIMEIFDYGNIKKNLL